MPADPPKDAGDGIEGAGKPCPDCGKPAEPQDAAVLLAALPRRRPEPLAVRPLRHSRPRKSGRRRGVASERLRATLERRFAATRTRRERHDLSSARVKRRRTFAALILPKPLSTLPAKPTTRANRAIIAGGSASMLNRRRFVGLAAAAIAAPPILAARARRRRLAAQAGAHRGAVHAGRLDRHHRAPGRQPPAGGVGPVGGDREQARRRRQHRLRHGRAFRSRRLHHLHRRPRAWPPTSSSIRR